MWYKKNGDHIIFLIESQLEHDDEGNITKFRVKPKNKIDHIAAENDVCYTTGRYKGECDKEMVKKIDALPHGDITRMGMLARNIINTKQKLGLDLKKLWSQRLADELHKPIKRNFPWRKAESNGVDDIWNTNLVDMQNLQKYNKGYHFIS